MRPVLRYFDCRSRGQALRFALEDAGVSFDVLGDPFVTALRGARRMSQLFHAMEARPGVAAARARLPFQVTASPSEIILRERLAQD